MKKIRCIMLTKIDDAYLTDYLNKQALKGYRLKQMYDPILIFERDDQAAEEHYTAIPRGNFEASLRIQKQAPDHLILNTWRFHIVKGEASTPVSVVSQYLDMLIVMLMYVGLLGAILRYMNILKALGYAFDRWIPMIVLSGLLLLWQIIFLILRVRSINWFSKLQKTVPLRNLLSLLLIVMWVWGYAAAQQLDFLHILYMLFILVLLFAVRINRLAKNHSFWLQGGMTVFIIGLAVISGMQLLSRDSDAYTCRHEAYTLYLKDLGKTAKTTDCIRGDTSYTYRESDQKYTMWSNHPNLPMSERENILSNFFFQYKDEKAAAMEFNSFKQSSDDGEPNDLDNNWKIDQGYFVYGDGVEILIIQKDNRIYEYTMEKGKGYDGDWMRVVKDKFFKK